ncbi:hypothetical protein GGU10DRAFT_380769 [Lentinula aff. detonsa]|uniref:Zn(2)-C6 fungal-type domain-containing protein n=1 Tax=Lentinula aff. detonsa TaxID=2804958 RepID=A0AA38KD77_9AGAR|nr:hypothetical protein GGU10DRAFT_380769 [Lentinula aff. detonsa]
MSTTSSPALPARSPTPVQDQEEVELQARLREEKASGTVADERKIVEEKEVVEEDVEVETEVVPKVEPRPRKVAIKMVAGVPRSREVIPIISIPKKRKVEPVVAEPSRKKRKVVQSPVMVDTDSDSILVPFSRPCERCIRGDQVCRPQPNAPNAVACDRCHVARQSCSFLRKLKKTRVRSPPNESDREEKRELHYAIEELTIQIHALVRQGQKGRESRGDCRDDRKGKGKRRESTPETC